MGEKTILGSRQNSEVVAGSPEDQSRGRYGCRENVDLRWKSRRSKAPNRALSTTEVRIGEHSSDTLGLENFETSHKA
jgi:hypothetical protein